MGREDTPGDGAVSPAAGCPHTGVFPCQCQDGSFLPRPPMINHLPTQHQAGGDALKEMCHQDHCGDSGTSAPGAFDGPTRGL